jgi:hypothetical protein
MRYYEAYPYNFCIMCDVCNGKTEISLRLLDWLCTNYSKSHMNTFTSKSNVEIYHMYKNNLRGFGKRYFDPFCRRGGYDVCINDQSIKTNIGQMNFFKWAIDNGVIEFAKAHKCLIDGHMNRRIKDARHKRRIEQCNRQHLSELASNHCHKRIKVIRISFS